MRKQTTIFDAISRLRQNERYLRKNYPKLFEPNQGLIKENHNASKDRDRSSNPR